MILRGKINDVLSKKYLLDKKARFFVYFPQSIKNVFLENIFAVKKKIMENFCKCFYLLL